MICYFCLIVLLDKNVSRLLKFGEQVIVLAFALKALEYVFLLLVLLLDLISHERRLERVGVALALLATVVANILFNVLHIGLWLSILRLVHLCQIGILSDIRIVVSRLAIALVEFLELWSHRWSSHRSWWRNRSGAGIPWHWHHVHGWPATLHGEIHRRDVVVVVVLRAVPHIIVVLVSEVVHRGSLLVAHLRHGIVELLELIRLVHVHHSALLVLLLNVVPIFAIVSTIVLKIHVLLRTTIHLPIHLSLVVHVVHVVLGSRRLVLIVEVIAEVHELTRILVGELLVVEILLLLLLSILVGKVFVAHHVSALILHLSLVSTQHT